MSSETAEPLSVEEEHEIRHPGVVQVDPIIRRPLTTLERRLLLTLDRDRSIATERIEEAVAIAIYDDMRMRDPEGRNRPWVPGGNSLKQVEARQRARAALSQETPEAPAPDSREGGAA